MKIKTASISFLIVIALLLGPSVTILAESGGNASIYLGPMASGEAVRILSTAYVLQPLTNACPDCLGIVVGPGDLSNPSIVNRLKAAYDAGQAIGLTNATTASIQRLHDLIGHRGSVQPVPGSATADLVAFRKAFRADGQLHSSSHLLMPRIAAPPAGPLLTKKDKKRIKRLSNKGLRRKLRTKLTKRRTERREREQQQHQRAADRSDIRALSRIFSAAPVLPPPPPPGDSTAAATLAATSSPQQSLLQVAESYQTHQIQTDSWGNQAQVINSVWAVRSFQTPATNSVDYYYVLQETDFHVVQEIVSNGNTYILCPPCNNGNGFILGQTASSATTGVSPTVEQASPSTTVDTTVDTSSTSYSISGSVGWDGLNTLDASITGGMNITNSQSTTVPGISITNNTDFDTGHTSWSYQVNDPPSTVDYDLSSLFCQWIWQVPVEDYPGTAPNFYFGSQATFSAEYIAATFPPTGITTNFNAWIYSGVPKPFGSTFALQPPVVTGVTPSCVNSGDQFTISGTGFYPSLVQSVEIGGTPVSLDSIDTISDTEIKVIAPNTDACQSGSGCPVAVVTAQGTSNTNFNIVISDSCN